MRLNKHHPCHQRFGRSEDIHGQSLPCMCTPLKHSVKSDHPKINYWRNTSQTCGLRSIPRIPAGSWCPLCSDTSMNGEA